MHSREVPGERRDGGSGKDWRRPSTPEERAEVFTTDWAQVVGEGTKRSYSTAAARASRTAAKPALTEEQAEEYINSLPERQRRYAKELWEWISGRGLTCPRQTADTFKHNLTWPEAQDILNTLYARER